MKVLNIHERNIAAPKATIVDLMSTLSGKDDKVWPIGSWPRMRFKDGLKEGSEGGHGPIRYQVRSYDPEKHIVFQFQKPAGFNGTHCFEINEINEQCTQIKHTIEMNTSGTGTISWLLAIRSLHDALIEDAFDRIQNQLTGEAHNTPWSLWVKLLRIILK